ncbi:MAG: hypothetical protein A4E32_01515 [Methanomassiliicoccales archaeon PtaU1.Bin124]|nr:MAG: hypothetical protein A4E32_01515 [Methanomassiliicoccales archaeon PtaU1.Bin124]
MSELKEKVERFLDSWEGMYMILMAVAMLIMLSLFIPPFSDVFSDDRSRFIPFIIALFLLAIACIGLTFPHTDEQFIIDDYRKELEPRRYREDLDDDKVQLDLYRELRQTLVLRIRMKRKIDKNAWTALSRDDEALRSMVDDEDLRAFLRVGLDDRIMEREQSVVIFGEGFRRRFDSLLLKVEEWA